MKAHIHFDLREFNAALKQAIEKSSRVPSLVVNSQGYHLAVGALNATKHADADKIAHELGQTATKAFKSTGKKGSKVFSKRKRTVRIFADKDTLAHRIINARRRAEGKKMIWGEELNNAAVKLRNARLRAVHFIRAGWIPAIKKLSSIIRGNGLAGGPQPDRGPKARGTPKGGAIPAPKGELRAVCQIFNSAILPKGRFSSRAGNPMAFAEDGLQKAARESIRDMKAHIERKVMEISKAHSAK